jgi:hypothetical protein
MVLAGSSFTNEFDKILGWSLGFRAFEFCFTAIFLHQPTNQPTNSDA